MAQEVRVPELGENIESAEVTAVLVQTGQNVVAEQGLIEVESDKAALEIPAPVAGIVGEIKVKAGQKIRVGQVILFLESEVGAQSTDSNGDPAAAPPPAHDPTKPDEHAGSSSTSTPDVVAGRQDPDTHHAYRKGGDTVALPPAKKPDAGNPVPASPSVRMLARELGVEINRISGSGPHGRISIEDIKAFTKDIVQRRHGGTGAASGMAVVRDLPDFARFGSIRRESMSSIRRKIADKMSLSWSQIPHVTQFDEADLTDLEIFRKSKARSFEKAGTRLTLTAILLKMTGLALARFPNFNASLDLEHDEIIYKEYINIGVAVDTSRGLLVPVLRKVDQKSILELAAELNDLAGRARARKTKPDELVGSNFSLTNLGGLGTTHFTPIINWPDVAVLGIGRAKQTAVMQDGVWQPRQIMPLSLSYDHRIIDGADAARFLRWISEALENPLHIFL